MMFTLNVAEAPTATVAELGVTEPAGPWLLKATITRCVVPPLVPLIANGYGLLELAVKSDGKSGGINMLTVTVAVPPGMRGPEAVHEKSDRITVLPCVPMTSGKSLQPRAIALLKPPVAAAVTL